MYLKHEIKNFTDARSNLYAMLTGVEEAQQEIFDEAFARSKNESLTIATRSHAMKDCLRVMKDLQITRQRLAVLRASVDLFPC
jgi:hypothetical protein